VEAGFAGALCENRMFALPSPVRGQPQDSLSAINSSISFLAVSFTLPVKASETLRTLLEHRATVRRQNSTALEKSIAAATI
jgi:hypothetical protein